MQQLGILKERQLILTTSWEEFYKIEGLIRHIGLGGVIMPEVLSNMLNIPDFQTCTHYSLEFC